MCRERKWNGHFHATENHLSKALCTLSGILSTETLSISRKIKEIQQHIQTVLVKDGDRSYGRLKETEQYTDI